MVRLLQPKREVTVTQICYNQGMQKNTSESTMRKKHEDCQQQQNTTLGATPFSKEQDADESLFLLRC